MGGMGRSFDGSYAEYALLPEKNVFSVDTEMSWEQLAAIPESFYTAYGSLVDCLPLDAGDSLMIRGATSTVGLWPFNWPKQSVPKSLQPLVQLPSAHCYSRSAATKWSLITERCLIRYTPSRPTEEQDIGIAGPATLSESLHLAAFHGIVCSTGVLGNRYFLPTSTQLKKSPTAFIWPDSTVTFRLGKLLMVRFGLIRPEAYCWLFQKYFPSIRLQKLTFWLRVEKQMAKL